MAGGGGGEVAPSGKGKRGGSTEFSLNLAPIIDCLTVLIAYVMLGAVFMSTGVLDASILPPTTTPPPASEQDKVPTVSITVSLEANQTMIVTLTGDANETKTVVPSSPGKWDTAALTEFLKQVKEKWPKVNAITLSAGSSIHYDDVVRVIESTRKTFPGVVLGEPKS